MKNIKYILQTVLMILVISSCNKNDIEEVTNKNVSTLLSERLGFPTDLADFTVSITSSKGISKSTNSRDGEDAVGIEAYAKTKSKIGKLSCNSLVVPYNENGYFWQKDSLSHSIEVLNTTVSVILEGELFPSFSTTIFSPSTTTWTTLGLEDTKLIRNQGCTLNLTSNDGNQEVTYYLIVYGENENSNHTYSYRLGATPQSIEITSEILSEFNNFDAVTIDVLKGFNKRSEIEGKSIDIRCISHSYSTLYFKN